MTHLVRRIQSTISGQAAEPIRRSVKTGPPGNDDQRKIERVIDRVYRFKAMVDSIAERFDVNPILVFKPGPLYRYDPPVDYIIPRRGRNPAVQQSILLCYPGGGKHGRGPQ